MKFLIKLYVMVIIFTITIYGKNPMEIIITNENINWLSILLPVTTMLIVVAGFFITRKQLENTQKLALKNIRIEVLSKNRQDWINTLRNELSNYIGKLNEFIQLSGFEHDEKFDKEYIVLIREITTIEAKIELLLNFTEQLIRI